MKRYFLFALALLLMVGPVDVSGQSFFKELEKAVKKEIEKEIENAIDEAFNGDSNSKSQAKSKKKSKKKSNTNSKSASKSASKSKSKSKSSSSSNSSISKSESKSSSSAEASLEVISKMDTWALSIRDEKPHYEYFDSSTAERENYYLDEIKYEHPDGVKPFMFTTAVATFKAKDGYQFSKKLKFKENKPDAENTTGFKYVNKTTVKVYLTAFTGAMGHDVRISEAMKQYKKKVSRMNLTPIATAQINAPLFDHWQLKLQRRDFESSDLYVSSFIKKNMRAYYQYPTTEEYYDTNGDVISGAMKENLTSEYRILGIDILDDDLSDDIPGLVGEWCLISKNLFIPKACLKDIKYGGDFADAPGKIVNSPFVFAGGTGTIEDPYLIATADQLNAVRKGPQDHYKLIADIDLSNWGNWIPIGGTAAYGFMGGGNNKAEKGAWSFQGSFDGNGHVISGMQIVINEETPFMSQGGNWRAYGLFANLATNPDNYKIKNLGVVNFNIDVTYYNVKRELNLYASAICGGMNNGTDIINCYSKGGTINIKVKGNDAYKPGLYGKKAANSPRVTIYAGGISSTGAGQFVGIDNPRKTNLHIERCFNDSHITVNAENCDMSLWAGGIIGTMNTTHIHECYNSGNITLTPGYDDLMSSPTETMAGGICAYAFISEISGIYHMPPERASFIQNCYNTGQITARTAAGIFGLSLSDIHLENCYNVGEVIGNEFELSNGQPTINPIFAKSCAIKPYGKEYLRNCTTNGNSVSGSAWVTSSTLNRKVLASIPEDSHPSKVYNVAPEMVGEYTDVKALSWYGEAVQWALDRGILSSTSATKFSPNKSCTRGDFLTFLWHAAGSPMMDGSNPFSDVNETDSYYHAALWAKEKGLVSGNNFAAGTACTRSETVITLWKNAGCPDAMQSNQYLDIANHQSEIGKAISWGFMSAVMAGTAEYTFSPNNTCTRGEIINYIYRALKK